MIEVTELQAWVSTLKPYNGVAVDEGGLTLREITYAGELTDAFLEVGGDPEPEKDGNRKSYREIASDFELWGEFVDPSGRDSREDFDAFTIEQRIAFIVASFGTEEETR